MIGVRARHKRRLVIWVWVSLLACLLVFSLLFFHSVTAPYSGSSAKIEFVVERGDSVSKIAGGLADKSLIRSVIGFRYAVKKSGLGSKIQAGTYQLSPDMSAYEIAIALTRGISNERLTIPEGYRLEQVAEAVESQLGIAASDVIAASIGKEGTLFPDTYFLPPTISASGLVELMQKTFVDKIGEGIDQETLTIASLVERETKADAEKPIVAGILYKRLAAGWPLQLDATVQYVLGKPGAWWPVTTLADRQVKSPYNTYLSLGLPPGPICNPGLPAIRAALSPAESEYWYYLHGKDGVIRYAVTSDEHSANIARYLH